MRFKTYFSALLCAIFLIFNLNVAYSGVFEKELANSSLKNLAPPFKPKTHSQSQKTDLQKSYEDIKNSLTKPNTVLFKSALDQEINNKKSIFEVAKEQSADAKPLTIEAVRVLALKNNLSLKIAEFAPEIATTFVNEERAKFDQTIYANATFLDADQDFISGDIVKFSSFNPALKDQIVKLTKEPTRTKYTDAELGIAVPLQTGGNVKIGTTLKNKDSDGIFPSDFYNAALKFSISQPLLRNRGVDVNRASIKIAELNQQATSAQTKLQSIRIIATLDKAYWAMYQAWLSLAVRQQQFDYATQNFNMVSRRVEEGLSARIEMNRAQIGVADRVDALVIAKTNLKIAQRNLQFYLNDLSSESEANSFLPATEPSLIGYQFNREALIDSALNQRLDLLEQELKLAADLTKIDYLENQTLPLFTIDYQYGALSKTSDRASDSFRTLNNPYNEWSIGFNFEMPLSNAARKSQLNRAVSERMMRLSTKSLQTLTVKREILDALDYVEQDWSRITAARQQVMVAGVNYEAELKQFNEGLRTMTEVIESLTRLGDSQLKEIQSIVDYQVSLIDLSYATGTLFGYSDIEVKY